MSTCTCSPRLVPPGRRTPSQSHSVADVAPGGGGWVVFMLTDSYPVGAELATSKIFDATERVADHVLPGHIQCLARLNCRNTLTCRATGGPVPPGGRAGRPRLGRPPTLPVAGPAGRTSPAPRSARRDRSRADEVHRGSSAAPTHVLGCDPPRPPAQRRIPDTARYRPAW